MAEEHPLESPFCAHLRSKKTYFLQGPPLKREDVLDASNHCWCAKTCTFLGPDHDLVDPDDCRAGRACFQSMFSRPAPQVEA